jgi:4-diphosphocytidyl-2-C-methyl-D-erythritol kinase
MSAAMCARAPAPAKINLGLFVGPVRASDGRHELASVMQSISLADELTLERIEPGKDTTGSGEDEICCPGVPGDPHENLAARALRAYREATGWNPGPLRLTIDKRIPLAAGLAGGSADAAATLRLAHHLAGVGADAGGKDAQAQVGRPNELLLELAAGLGADVPAQIAPGRWLATGAGERIRELPGPSHPFGVLVLPLAAELSSAAVYARADELGAQRTARRDGASQGTASHGTAGWGATSQRTAQQLIDAARGLERALELGAGVPERRELLHNDLQAAAISLCPEIEPALTQALHSGADVAFVSGSGPTVVGLFLRANGPGRAQRAAAGLCGRDPAPICATPVDGAFARLLDVPVRHNHDR